LYSQKNKNLGGDQWELCIFIKQGLNQKNLLFSFPRIFYVGQMPAIFSVKSQAINKPMHGMIFVLNIITNEINGHCFRLQLSSSTTSNGHCICYSKIEFFLPSKPYLQTH